MHLISCSALSTFKKEKAPPGAFSEYFANILCDTSISCVSELQRMGQLVDCFEAGSDIDKVSVTWGRCLSLSLSIRTMKQSSGDWHLNIPETQTSGHGPACPEVDTQVTLPLQHAALDKSRYVH